MSPLVPLRVVSLAEGVSLLVLLCVAMPLKYLYGLPVAARVVGGVHGLLFLALVSTLWHAHTELSWTRGRALKLLALAVLPLGFLPIDRELKREASKTPSRR